MEERITDLSQKMISLFRSHVSWRLSAFSAMARRKVTFPIFQRQSSISGSLEDERRKMITTTMARMSQELRERSSPLASTRTRDVYVRIYVYIYIRVYIILLSLQSGRGSVAVREQRYYQIGSASFPWSVSAKSPGRRGKVRNWPTPELK